MIADSATWLCAWEQGAEQSPLDRALTLLSAAEPGASREHLASLSIGERDVQLIRARERLFGDEVCAVVDCPSCGSSLEITFLASALLSGAPDDEALTFTLAGRNVELRRVTTRDLRAIGASATQEALLERVVVSPDTSELPPIRQWLDEGSRRLEIADPQAHIEVAVDCPDCGHSWTSAYDIVGFLWKELEAWAERTLREVHLLASAYGWSEADILHLSATRRRRYLELVSR